VSKAPQGVNIREFYTAIEISKMRKLMKYNHERYTEDWNTAIAVSILMATGGHDRFEMVLEGCMNRILAYQANNPEDRPWEDCEVGCGAPSNVAEAEDGRGWEPEPRTCIL
jgi:hypothetical protein